MCLQESQDAIPDEPPICFTHVAIYSFELLHERGVKWLPSDPCQCWGAFVSGGGTIWSVFQTSVFVIRDIAADSRFPWRASDFNFSAGVRLSEFCFAFVLCWGATWDMLSDSFQVLTRASSPFLSVLCTSVDTVTHFYYKATLRKLHSLCPKGNLNSVLPCNHRSAMLAYWNLAGRDLIWEIGHTLNLCPWQLFPVGATQMHLLEDIWLLCT